MSFLLQASPISCYQLLTWLFSFACVSLVCPRKKCLVLIFLLAAKLLTEELEAPASKFSPKQKKTSPPKPQRRMEHADFSDGYDADDASTEELDMETAERLTYNHEQQGT